MPISDRASLPAVFDKATDREIPDRTVAFWMGRTDDNRGEPELHRALLPAERAQLEKRGGDLRAALAPATPDMDSRMRAAIGAMLGGFGQMRRHDKATAAVIASAYLYVVRDEPPWAILEACEAIRSGMEGLNPAFDVNEAQFAIAVRRRAAVYRKTLLETEAMLRAKVQPPPPPKLSKEEIEAALGRPIGESVPDALTPIVKTIADMGQRITRSIESGAAARRVESDLAERRVRRGGGA